MSGIDDIEKALRIMKDRGAEMKAFEGLLTEIGSALADIVSLMEKDEKAEAREQLDLGPLVQAIKGLKLEAPKVEVNVSPTPITVKVPEAAAPTVNVHPMLQADNWASLEIKVNRGRTGNGPMESFTVSKIK